MVSPFLRDGRERRIVLPHLKTPAPLTRYRHLKVDQMNQPCPTAGRVVREAEGVWISDGRSGVGSGTKSVQTVRCGFDVLVLGITYLDLFLAERDAVHDVCAGDLVGLGVLLVFGFENCVVLRAVPHVRVSRRVLYPRPRAMQIAYLVRRRFWRASNLLSTRGGRFWVRVF